MSPRVGVLLLSVFIMVDSRTGAEERFTQQFEKNPLNLRQWRLLGSHPEHAIQQVSNGLEIKLSVKGATGERAGVGTRFGVEGDFEVTIGYELAELQGPDKGYGTGIMLALVTADEPPLTISLSHRRQIKGEMVFGTNVWTTVNKKMKSDVKHYSADAAATQGQLRVLRTGSVIHFLVAEGGRGDFRELRQTELGAQHLRSIQVWGDTGGSTLPLRTSLTHFTIRADRLPYGSPARQRGSIFATWAILGAIGATVLIGCGVWFWRRSSSS